MDCTQDMSHPYYTEYNWLIERFANGCDEAEYLIRELCVTIRDYDLFHSECLNVVRAYSGRKK